MAGYIRGGSVLPYILNTEADRKAMLAKIGVASVGELFTTIPAPFQLNRELQVPPLLQNLAVLA